ncbi:hypothetical protein [Candidatus Enterovibrio altilux]|uniref:hypothetical protein n=1 Tax=Candidatus Enterovibrio altilux TaxID=1927128 RepID=UPI000BBC748D|nr:hypothetical protein [Candidatus Enterovibrio luxaltus]
MEVRLNFNDTRYLIDESIYQTSNNYLSKKLKRKFRRLNIHATLYESKLENKFLIKLNNIYREDQILEFPNFFKEIHVNTSLIFDYCEIFIITDNNRIKNKLINLVDEYFIRYKNIKCIPMYYKSRLLATIIFTGFIVNSSILRLVVLSTSKIKILIKR